MLEIQKLLKENNINGIELLKDKPYRLLIKKVDDLYIFNYSDKSPKDITICQEARCLILEEDNWNIVYWGFKRFFNINDDTSNRFVGIYDKKEFLNNKDIYCLEKLDGSILGLFYHPKKNKWRITTKSVIDSETPMSFTQLTGNEKTFKELFNKIISKKNNFFERLNTNLVYTFEIVSPENKIITPYTKEDEDLYLTGVRNKKNNFQELPFDDLKEIAANIGVKTPKIFKVNSYENIVSQINMLKNLEEGFVCVDYEKHYDKLNYPRLKIKNPKYLFEILDRQEFSYLNLTSLVIFEQDDDFKSLYPKYTKDLDKIKKKYIDFIDDVENEFNKFKQYKIRKEFSKHTSRHKYRGLLFCMYEGLSVEEAIFNNLKNKSEKNISKMLYNNKWITKD